MDAFGLLLLMVGFFLLLPPRIDPALRWKQWLERVREIEEGR